jgi:hypothetical protein
MSRRVIGVGIALLVLTYLAQLVFSVTIESR